MGKKKKCKACECPAGEKWAVPTADFFSLLLALFIALYAIASTNKEKMKAVKEEFVKIYDFAPVPEAVTPVVDMVTESEPLPKASSNPAGDAPVKDVVGTPNIPLPDTTTEAVDKLQKDLQDASMSGNPLDQTMDGVLLKLPASVPFNGTSTTIDTQENKLFLKRMAQIIQTLPETVEISVRGYTDNLSSSHMSNIEISSRRADSVIRELIANGVSPNRLSSAAFGSSKPFARNDTEENRAKNRRVEFYMFVSNDNPISGEKEKNILDALDALKK